MSTHSPIDVDPDTDGAPIVDPDTDGAPIVDPDTDGAPIVDPDIMYICVCAFLDHVYFIFFSYYVQGMARNTRHRGLLTIQQLAPYSAAKSKNTSAMRHIESIL